MNVYDSEQMALILGQDYELTEQAEDADLYLINTCAIRRKSEEKVLSLLGRLKTLKQRRPQMLLGVGGCVAQQEGEQTPAAGAASGPGFRDARGLPVAGTAAAAPGNQPASGGYGFLAGITLYLRPTGCREPCRSL